MRASTILGAAMIMMIAAAPGQAQGMKSARGGKTMAMNVMSGKAIAVLSPVPGGKVQGTVTFERTDAGLRIVADVSGLSPGKHGFHVHEFGDCSAADYTSAGSHLMTAGQKHGAPGDPDSHLGDLGNLEADASGHAHYEWVDARLSLTGPNSILGRGLIVHAGADDLSTQPTGKAGGRVACGVIGLARS